jgi:Ser/Thr protein kinase RdoA (MazF antagonist)
VCSSDLGRWSDKAIQEEHDFSLELAAAELPVAAPLRGADGRTLQRHGPFRFALYPRQAGRAPDLDDPQPLEQLGRLLARVHNIGALRPFVQRPSLSWQHFGQESYRWLLEQGFIPQELRLAYRSLVEDLLVQIQACFARAGSLVQLRLHGDCHPGNILWAQDGPHLVDLDDARNGPALQDLWMLLSGERPQMTAGLAQVLDGYTQFRDFDPRELHLLEALRTLRMLHHSA